MYVASARVNFNDWTENCFMKIHCPCGAIIPDSSSGLPQKAHIIPDQEWDPLTNALEKVIADAILLRIEPEAAFMQVHILLGEAQRPAFQCRYCGRLLADDRLHKMHTFVPESQATVTEIFRSRHDAA